MSIRITIDHGTNTAPIRTTAYSLLSAIAFLQAQQQKAEAKAEEKTEATPTREDLQERVKQLENCLYIVYQMFPEQQSFGSAVLLEQLRQGLQAMRKI